MQKLLSRAPIVYFIFLLGMTSLFTAFLFLGYRFIVANQVVWLVLSILAEGIIASICLVKRKAATKTAKIIAQLLPFCALLYFFVLLILLDSLNIYFQTVHGLFCFLSCYVVALLHKIKRIFRIVCAVLNSILFILLLAASNFIMAFGSIAQNTIVRQVMSPDQSYAAILIDSEQGALGGNTWIDIEYRTSNIPVGYGRFVKVTRVYTGRCGEFETISMEWQDDHTLLIDGKSYRID